MSDETYQRTDIQAGQVWLTTYQAYGNRWLILDGIRNPDWRNDHGVIERDGWCYDVRPLECHKNGWKGVWSCNERNLVMLCGIYEEPVNDPLLP